jgi:hypothetical protein
MVDESFTGVPEAGGGESEDRFERALERKVYLFYPTRRRKSSGGVNRPT